MQQLGFNKLKDENSKYLKQHENNPVHWYPWGPEAIQKSKDENKPIFLSIGYSSCHWCHIMAEESFSDDQTASFLNENFINIKVDKEEYPDIDNYYQQACQIYTQSGGWPLSAFLMPDLKPFFVGTYFPKHSNGQGASFMDILGELTRAYQEENSSVLENANKAAKSIEEGFIPKDKVEFTGHFPPPMSILEVLKSHRDDENGGYGDAPKFPQFAFNEWAIEQMLEGMVEKEDGNHIIKTIENMLMGGIYDHARGGIHRYSVDHKWQVPHFEKMLYDQAGLLRMLSKASLIYPSALIFDAIYNTLEYLHLEMIDEKKYFFSGQDADSEGVEGLYFTFSLEEFEDAVASIEDEKISEKIEDIKKWFNITKEGNFENNLNIITLNQEAAKEYFNGENWEIIRTVRKALLTQRKMRIPPGTDNKGIASWNFMMISALADVMQYCQIPAIKSAASQLFNQAVEGCYKTFIENNERGMSLSHTTTIVNPLNYLEDYVFFAEAQLRIYELSGNEIFKNNVKDTLQFVIDQFLDGDKLLTRSKNTQEHELYPNQSYNPFDQSFKSPVSTLIATIRRASVLFKDVDLLDSIKELRERVTHDILKNPVGSGEALRSLTYPDEAYKTIKCPRSWLDKEEFAGFINYFLPRFVLDYHDEGNESWEICNMSACEINGEGIENFINTLRPAKQEGANE